ncbi:hypothetical protein Tco_1157828 [Tanacetum coccineum]
MGEAEEGEWTLVSNAWGFTWLDANTCDNKGGNQNSGVESSLRRSVRGGIDLPKSRISPGSNTAVAFTKPLPISKGVAGDWFKSGLAYARCAIMGPHLYHGEKQC